MDENGRKGLNTFREIKRICCVPFCKSINFDNKQLVKTGFYEFPDAATDLITYRCWLREIRKCKTEVGETIRDTKDAYVCELHFRKGDFVVDMSSGKKLLKKGSVPHLSSSDDIDFDHPSNNNLEIKTSNKDDLSEEQKKLRNYKLSLLKEKIEFQKDPSRLKLLQQKEEQEEKLRQLLAQQEEHKKKMTKEKQKPQVITPNLVKLERERMEEIEKVRKIEKQENEMRNSEREVPAKSSKVNIHDNNFHEWKKKKENLQIMLEQQKVRLAEIQKQESDFDIRKRKRHLDEEEEVKIENDFVNASVIPSSNTSVISCGKCFKLQAQLSEVTQHNKDLREENELLRSQLKKFLYKEL